MLRLCFAGTPAFAAAHLQVLLASSHHVAAVYTQPDRPSGRGNKLVPSAVKQLANAHGIPVAQPVSLKSAEAQTEFAAIAPDLLVVVAYGLILPQAILDIPRFGCINVHASLLPRWRGAAPIERALLAGDRVTGVTIMQMDAGLDTGDMLTTESIAISETDTREDLESRLAAAGGIALLRTLDNLQELQKKAEKQDSSQSSYAAKLEKSEAVIDWAQSAELINRQIRAGVGRTPAYSFLGDQRLRILRASVVAVDPRDSTPGTILTCNRDEFRVACGSSQLAVQVVQLPGKTAMQIGDLLNSLADFFRPGTVLRTDDAASR